MPGFDPYRDWLGIPADQPRDFFSLLGVDRQMTDPAGLRQAAEKQAQKVAVQRAGPKADVAEKLLKRIKRAYRTLSSPERREAYLQSLAPRSSSTDPSVESLFEDADSIEANEPSPERLPAALFEGSASGNTRDGDFVAEWTSAAPVRRRSGIWLPITSLLFVLINLGILGYWWFFVRIDPAAEMRAARERAMEERRPSAPSADGVEPPSSAKGANLGPPQADPSLQPEAFRTGQRVP